MLLDLAKYFLSAIATGAISILVVYLGMADFILAQIEANPMAFAIYTVLAVLTGALMTGVVSALYYRSKIRKMEDERKKVAAEKDERISELTAEKDARVAELTAEVAKLTANLKWLRYDYDNLVEANEGDPAHDALCEELLGVFVRFKDEPHLVEAHVREQLGGGILQNVSFGKAFNELIKYECVSGCPLYASESGRYCLYGDVFNHRLLKERFPSFLNRKLKDNEVEPMSAEEVLRAFEEGCRIAELKSSRGLA